MNKKKLRLGLIGKDVTQSDSERIHRFLLNELGVECEYQRFSVSMSEFDNVLRLLLGDFDGFNVTIPYKRDVMEYLDGMSGDALKYGAVNTVTSQDRMGYNTDGEGFLQMLSQEEIPITGKKILVLGGGGSGRSTAKALQDKGATVYLYQRNAEKLAETCAQLSVLPATQRQIQTGGNFDIIVNCTGIGMHNSQGASPVEAEIFNGAEYAIDLIYTPPVTQFLQQAASKGVKTLNGKAMLFYQAYYADCIFLNMQPNSEQAIELYKKYQETLP